MSNIIHQQVTSHRILLENEWVPHEWIPYECHVIPQWGTSYINGSRRIEFLTEWISRISMIHVTCNGMKSQKAWHASTWFVSRMDEAHHMWKSWVAQSVIESRHTHEWVMSNLSNVSTKHGIEWASHEWGICAWMRHVTYEGVESHRVRHGGGMTRRCSMSRT